MYILVNTKEGDDTCTYIYCLDLGNEELKQYEVYGHMIVTNLYITVTLVLPISYYRLSKKDEGPYMNTVHTNYVNTTINGPEGKISVKHNLFINSL